VAERLGCEKSGGGQLTQGSTRWEIAVARRISPRKIAGFRRVEYDYSMLSALIFLATDQDCDKRIDVIEVHDCVLIAISLC
jgi:hypothetical protein